MSGYIKAHRSLMTHWIFQDAEKFRRWMVMLWSVNYKPAKVMIGNSLYEVNAGQAVFSIQTWGDKLGLSKKAVLAFFELLKSDGMISTETIGKGNRSSTRVTITNYACYQGSEAPEDTPQQHRKGNRKGNREGITSKEGKESKEEKKERNDTSEQVFEIPTLEQLIAYADEKGFMDGIAYEFFEKYTNLGWKKQHGGEPIANWKLTMQTWMKRDYNAKWKKPVHRPVFTSSTKLY